MKQHLNRHWHLVLFAPLATLPGCIPPQEIARPELPSLAYTRSLHQDRFDESDAARIGHVPEHRPRGEGLSPHSPEVQAAYNPSARASYRFVKDLPFEGAPEGGGAGMVESYPATETPSSAPTSRSLGNGSQLDGSQMNGRGMVSNMEKPPLAFTPEVAGSSYEVTRNANPNVRPYQGPLSVGEPGTSASIWRAHGRGSRLFRDHRAFQPMDLITIVVSENAEGSKEADTETSKESSFLAGITELFNFTDSFEAANPGLETSTALDADFQSEFTGEGETVRRGSLQARIAAVVVEVLPNGVMRIEGEKIISVNNEEQLLIISGLVRPRDVSSMNEVMSSKIAYLRVDYFGKGMVGDAQKSGWLGRMVNTLWPF
ncbi:flagellar basal body L-ring protein FlgH [bacterium]|nr:flagellar basal body L-ring protein FlgH [bacterium]